MSSHDNKTPATHPESGGLKVPGGNDRATTPPPPASTSAPVPSTGQEKSQEKPQQKPQEDENVPQVESAKKG